jgi:uncharacterized membrane protein YhdT
MLGVKVETFRGNRILKAVVALIIVGAIFGFIATSGAEGIDHWLWMAVVIAPLIFILYWLSTVEITIYEEGISSNTFLGTTEMRWEDVTRFTYSATKHSVNYIPLGTYYLLCLENAQGQKIGLQHRVSGMEKLGEELIQRTLLPLLHKAVEQFNIGNELDFGLIKLSRTRGVKSKGLFNSIEVPLDQVIDYRIEEGQFYVFRQGKKTAAISAPIQQVPNSFALLALLDSIFQRRAPSAS